MVPEKISQLLIEQLGYLGGFGARLAARFLRESVGEATIPLTVSAEVAQNVAREILSATGKLIESSTVGADEGSIVAVVGAGAMKMNPAVLLVDITSASPNRSKVVVRGFAKEGFIKQNAGKTSVEEFTSQLQSAVKELA